MQYGEDEEPKEVSVTDPANYYFLFLLAWDAKPHVGHTTATMLYNFDMIVLTLASFFCNCSQPNDLDEGDFADME